MCGFARAGGAGVGIDNRPHLRDACRRSLINAEIVGSLEYGAAVLGVKVLLVIGHAGCGAVTAAMAKKAVPGQIASLYPHLEQAVEGGGDVSRTSSSAMR